MLWHPWHHLITISAFADLVKALEVLLSKLGWQLVFRSGGAGGLIDPRAIGRVLEVVNCRVQLYLFPGVVIFGSVFRGLVP